MNQDRAQGSAPPPATRSQHPALSISVPPPRSQRAVQYLLIAILVGAVALTLAGAVAYLLQRV